MRPDVNDENSEVNLYLKCIIIEAPDVLEIHFKLDS